VGKKIGPRLISCPKRGLFQFQKSPKHAETRHFALLKLKTHNHARYVNVPGAIPTGCVPEKKSKKKKIGRPILERLTAFVSVDNHPKADRGEGRVRLHLVKKGTSMVARGRVNKRRTKIWEGKEGSTGEK